MDWIIKKGKFGHRDKHTEIMLCEICSYAATSQGTTKARREAWNESFPSAFRESMALPTLWPQTLRYSVCGILLWKPYQTSTDIETLTTLSNTSI